MSLPSNPNRRIGTNRNSAVHSSTGTTPFSVVYGRDPPSFFPYVFGETKNAELEQQLLDRDDMLRLLRLNLTKAQDRMRNQANSKRRELSFQVGDYVLLKLQPYRQQSLAKRRFEKLSPRFFGPYRVTKKIGPVAYELDLPPDARIHPVFHVSMLKPFHGSAPPTSIAPLPITKDWEIDLQPASILAHRWTSDAGQPVLELLVAWSQRPIEEASWEVYDLLADQFPHFQLEDKSSFRGGSNDKNLRVYARRNRKVKAAGQEEQFQQLFGFRMDPLGQSPGGKIENTEAVQILQFRGSYH